MWHLTNTIGPFVRLAPIVISVSDPFLLPDICHKHAEKTPIYSTGIAGEVAPLLQLQDARDHAAKLKMLAPTVGSPKCFYEFCYLYGLHT